MRQKQIGDNWKVVAQNFFHPCKLYDVKFFIGKNIIYPQCRRDAIECPRNAGAFFHESILEAVAYGFIRVRIRNIVEIATNNYRVGAVINFIFYKICLHGSFYQAGLYFGNDTF